MQRCRAIKGCSIIVKRKNGHLPMKRQMAEISSNVISHIKSAHPIEMYRSNKLGIKEKVSRGNFPRLIFSCPVPSGLPHRSHCVPMNMNPCGYRVLLELLGRFELPTSSLPTTVEPSSPCCIRLCGVFLSKKEEVAACLFHCFRPLISPCGSRCGSNNFQDANEGRTSDSGKPSRCALSRS